MGSYIYQLKFMFPLIILCAIFPQSKSVLSFTYPQSTTLGNNNILVVEQNGIYICDSSFNNKISTLHIFPDEDKIKDEASLSKTLIKKSSLVILIFTNYKIFVIKTATGELLNNEDVKRITDAEPDYVTLAYIYTKPTASTNLKFFFAIGYIDNNTNYLKIRYYQFVDTDNTIVFKNSCSLNLVTRGSNTYNFQNRGLSCDYLIDLYDTDYSYITCFIIGNDGTNDYITPLTFYVQSDNTLAFTDNVYTMYKIKVNNNKQIKSETNGAMTISYVCYVTEAEEGTCYKFALGVDTNYGYFDADTKKTFPNNCRKDIYGMKINYIFETGELVFSCSGNDGSLQVYIYGETMVYLKYENCNNIYGYSVIYSDDLSNYYITSDVVCPEGIIPFDILEDSSEHNPEIIPIEASNKERTTDNINDNINDSETSNEERTTGNINENNNDSSQSVSLTSDITTDLKTTNILNINTNKITEEIIVCPEKCLECDSQKKCTKCNKSKNYYPIELTSQSTQTVECITESIKQNKNPNFYFDSETETFKPCFEKCDTCYGKGDGINNNCQTCEPGYIPHPDYENSTNCVPKPNSLYYIKYGQYQVTNSDRCPEDFSFLIEEKGKCIEDCKNDDKYNYTYDGRCYQTPPENTNDEDGDYICKDNPNKCVVTKNVLYTLNNLITKEEIETLVSKYEYEYSYTNHHISVYENNIYIITIYKNGECISELGLLSKIINFGDCYTELKSKNSINADIYLIVVDIQTKPGKEAFKINPPYGLYNPLTSRSLNYEEECKEKKITIHNNITKELNNSKVNLNDIKLMAEQGIDLFDPTSPFYSDLCTHYPDVLNKDIPLKKRALAYYPDIELCDDNCELVGVFLNNLTAKCQCSISGEANGNKKMNENPLYNNEFGDFEEFIYSTNINVIKCYKDLFVHKYFIKCYGGFIILSLILIQILCTVAYCFRSKFYLKKNIFCITNKYLNYLTKKIQNKLQRTQKISFINQNMNKISVPPRKINKDPTGVDIYIKNPNQNKKGTFLMNNNNILKNTKSINEYSNASNEKINIINSSNQRFGNKNKSFRKRTTNFQNQISIEPNIPIDLLGNIHDDLKLDIEEFLKTDPEDMDYDDAIRRDKRTFCIYYYEKIQSEQIILNTFFKTEILRPMPVKIMLLVLQIDLYFFINGLFYNEEYVTKIFELEKDSLSNQAYRFFDNLFYAFLVGVIINYIIEFFFIQEKKLRTTLKREKDNLLVLKYEMIQIIKDLEKRFLSFIIISFIISVFIWYHISCFNNIYSHMKKEWLIFSVLIIVCIQVLSLITSFIETVLRFLSFRFKSEKLFKLSLLLS